MSTLAVPASGMRVSTRRLVHIYRTEGHDVAALSGVDLDVDPGEVVGLLGPSGAGKSTLLSLLGGLFRPSAGKIFLDADELSAVSPRRLDELRATSVALMRSRSSGISRSQKVTGFFSARASHSFSAGRPLSS